MANWICHERRAYWFGSLLYFRIPDSTLTGCYVDQYSIQIFAPGKPKITASLELISSDYSIWNSKAPAPMVIFEDARNISPTPKISPSHSS
ncbi:AP-5 complex subunit mu-1 isoform X2 [Columba livia]|uniref:AP-5 complex subunit mu-1 isoform X2 n=1 Tax=Columba livia TaxID=8932 RepID=UPI0031BA989A